MISRLLTSWCSWLLSHSALSSPHLPACCPVSQSPSEALGMEPTGQPLVPLLSLCPQCLQCHLVSCFKGSSWSPLRPWVHMPFPAVPAGCATLTHSACTRGCRDLLAGFKFLYFPKKLVFAIHSFSRAVAIFLPNFIGFLKVAFGYFLTSVCV